MSEAYSNLMWMANVSIISKSHTAIVWGDFVLKKKTNSLK